MTLDEKPSSAVGSGKTAKGDVTTDSSPHLRDKELEKAVEELSHFLKKGTHHHSSATTHRPITTENSTNESRINHVSDKNERASDGSSIAVEHAMKPLNNKDTKDIKTDPIIKRCNNSVVDKPAENKGPSLSSSAQSFQQTSKSFVTANHSAAISCIEDISGVEAGHQGSPRRWHKFAGLLFSSTSPASSPSLPSSSRSSSGPSNSNCHSKVAEQIAVLFVRDDSGRMRTLHKLVAIVAVLPTLAICLTVALASTSSAWRYPLLPWQEAYLNISSADTLTADDVMSSSSNSGVSPAASHRPLSPSSSNASPITYSFPPNRKDQLTPSSSAISASASLQQQQQSSDPISVLNFGNAGFVSASDATSSDNRQQASFEDTNSRHRQVDSIKATGMAFRRRGGYDSAGNNKNRADLLPGDGVFSISTLPPLSDGASIQSSHHQQSRTSDASNDDTTTLEIRIKGTHGYRYPHQQPEEAPATQHSQEEPPRTRDQHSHIELDSPLLLKSPTPSPTPNSIPMNVLDRASLLARLRQRYEQAQVQWLLEEKRHRQGPHHHRHQQPAQMSSSYMMATTPDQLMSIHSTSAPVGPKSPLNQRIGMEGDETASEYHFNALTSTLSPDIVGGFRDSTVEPTLPYLPLVKSKSPSAGIQSYTTRMSSPADEPSAHQVGSLSGEIEMSTGTDGTGFPGKKPFGLGLMIPKIPLRKKVGVFTELPGLSTPTKDHQATSPTRSGVMDVGTNNKGNNKQGITGVGNPDGTAGSALDDPIPDALTVEELLAGKLDIETGIEEAVKAAYKSRGLDISDGMCDSYDLACMNKYGDSHGNSSPSTGDGSGHGNHDSNKHHHDSGYGGIRQYVSKGNFFRDRRFNLFVTGLLRNLAIEIRNFDNDPLFFRVYRPFEVEPETFDLSTFVLGRRFGRSLPTNSPSSLATDTPALPRAGTTLLERLMHRFSGQEGRMKVDGGSSMSITSSSTTMNSGGLLGGLRRNNRNRRRVVGGGVLRGLSNVTRTDDAQIQVLGSSSTLVRSDVALGPLTMELKLTLSRRRGLLRRRSEEDKIVVDVGKINLQTFTYIDDHGSSMADFTMLPIDIDRIQITLPEIRRMQQQETMADTARSIVQRIFSTKGFLARRLEEYAKTAMTSNIYSDAKKHPIRGGFQAVEYQ